VGLFFHEFMISPVFFLYSRADVDSCVLGDVAQNVDELMART
jgi:hypothetical protein